MRNLLTPKNAGDAAFWGGCLAVALILFFVVYDNNNFGGHWNIFALYVSINLMWMLVIGTAGIYSFATVGVVGACAYLAALHLRRLAGGLGHRGRPVAQRRPHAARRGRLSARCSGRSSRLRRSVCEGCTSPSSRSASPRWRGRSSSSRRSWARSEGLAGGVEVPQERPDRDRDRAERSTSSSASR